MLDVFRNHEGPNPCIVYSFTPCQEVIVSFCCFVVYRYFRKRVINWNLHYLFHNFLILRVTYWLSSFRATSNLHSLWDTKRQEGDTSLLESSTLLITLFRLSSRNRRITSAAFIHRLAVIKPSWLVPSTDYFLMSNNDNFDRCLSHFKLSSTPFYRFSRQPFQTVQSVMIISCRTLAFKLLKRLWLSISDNLHCYLFHAIG